MAKRHVMTVARRQALRKAQLASARKRKRSGKRPPNRSATIRQRQAVRVTQRRARTRRNVKRAVIGTAVIGGTVAGAYGTYAGATSPAVHRGVQNAKIAQFNRRNNATLRKQYVNRARADHAHVEALRQRMRLNPGKPFNARRATKDARSTLKYGRKLAGR